MRDGHPPPPGFSVRPARGQDWEAVAALHAASWRTAYRGIYPDSFLDDEVVEDRRAFWRDRRSILSGDEDAVFVAERGSRAIGFACVLRRADPAGPLLDNLHVDPECKHGGIGRELLRTAASWLVSRDAGAPLQLFVWAANAPARAFYRRLDAEEVETFEEKVPGGGTAPIVRMRWPRASILLD